MKTIILLLVAFLVPVYVYNFNKIRKNRHLNDKSIVLKFNEKYLVKKKTDDIQFDKTNYNKYITKYNSTVDYVEKKTDKEKT